MSAEDRAKLFADWCADRGVALPDGAIDQLVEHISAHAKALFDLQQRTASWADDYLTQE